MLRSDLLVCLIASISVVDSDNCLPNVTSIPVCSDDSVTSDIVYLSGVGVGYNTTECACSLSTGTSTNITITEHQIPHGCKYQFQFIYLTESRIYSCNQTSMISINTDDGIEINLLPGTEDRVRFAVCLEVKSERNASLRLSCGKSRWSTTTSYTPTVIQTSTTENITTPGDQSNQQTTITSRSESEQQTTSPSKNDNSMSAIIGGSVGGLVVIIVIIIIVICVRRKRRKDKNYGSPEAVETDRSGEISHQPKQNNELVHQKADPYTSIGNDIIKPNNSNQGMEYLENDLYISSDDFTDDVVYDNKPKEQLPFVTEYSQVNKSNTNKTTNRNFKTGPKGDNYAVVNESGKKTNNDNEQ